MYDVFHITVVSVQLKAMEANGELLAWMYHSGIEIKNQYFLADSCALWRRKKGLARERNRVRLVNISAQESTISEEWSTPKSQNVDLFAGLLESCCKCPLTYDCRTPVYPMPKTPLYLKPAPSSRWRCPKLPMLHSELTSLPQSGQWFTPTPSGPIM